MEFSQDYTVFHPKKICVYPISETDWERVKKLVNNIIPEKKIYNILASALIGIFVSSIFSLISLNTLTNLPDWILPTNWSISISSLTLGIVLMIIDNQQKDMIKLNSEFILKEMSDSEKQFDK